MCLVKGYYHSIYKNVRLKPEYDLADLLDNLDTTMSQSSF